jgi:hypothetical protein
METYLEHATTYLEKSNPTLVERVYYDRERATEGPQNPDNDPSSQSSNPIYSVCEEQGKRDDDEIKEGLNGRK